jgi:hypothetical protein
VIFLVEAAVIFGFPACAIWALWRGGRRQLWVVAGGCLAVIVAVGLAAASEQLGNRLSGHYGHWNIARSTTLLALLTAGLPVVAGALAVQSCRRWTSRPVALYILGVLASFAAFVLGAIVAVYLLSALR